MAEYISLWIKPHSVEALSITEAGEELKAEEHFSAVYSDESGLRKAIAEASKTFGHPSIRWFVGLPLEDFSFRYLSFPFKKEKAIKAALPFELDGILPYPVEELETSAYIAPASGESANVFACAILKEKIIQYRNVLKDAGIEASVLVPDITALKSFADRFCSSEEKLVLNAEKERMLVLSDSGGTLDFHVSETKVSGLKLFLASLEERQIPKPEKIFIGGRSAELFYDGDTEKTEKPMVPFGLAVCGASGKAIFNFSHHTGFSLKLTSGLRLQAVGFALACFIGIGYLLAGNYSKSVELEETKAEVVKVFKSVFPKSKPVKPLFQLKQKLGALEAKMKGAGLLEGERTDFLWILRELSAKMPKKPELFIDEISFSERGLSLNGKAKTFDEAEEVRKSLEKMGRYEKAEIAESSASTDKTSVSFRVRLK